MFFLLGIEFPDYGPTRRKLVGKSVIGSQTSLREIQMSPDIDFSSFSNIFADCILSLIWDTSDVCKFLYILCNQKRIAGYFSNFKSLQ